MHLRKAWRDAGVSIEALMLVAVLSIGAFYLMARWSRLKVILYRHAWFFDSTEKLKMHQC